jgi:hypothetical protein
MTGRSVDWFFSDTAAVANSKSPKRDDAIADLAASQDGQRLARAYLAIRSPQLRTAFLKLLEGSIG